MFDDLSDEIQRLSRHGLKVSVPMPSDSDGHDDRECPSPECLARFKVHAEDWTNVVSDAVVYCPICRFEADSQHWFTPEQIEYAQRVAIEEMNGRISKAFADGVRRANSRAPRSGFLSFSIDYKPGHRTYVAPLAAGEVLEQRSACEVCGCRYASIGAAFFCPACGHNSAISTFGDTIITVRASLDLIPKLAEMVGKDAAADLGRGIAENALVNLVTAFQRFVEASYEKLPDPKEAPGFNASQRLAEGDRLWRAATGRGYGDFLDPKEIAELGRFFQQRHILIHDQGIVDQLYLDRSGDTTYRLGQRLVTKPAASRRAADLVEKLARGIGSASP